MDEMFLPLISENDYEAFRCVMHAQIPTTFDEWHQYHTARLTEYGKMYRIIQINVNPDEFANFISSRGMPANGRSLLVFAEYVWKGKQ
jgi:hypothetical protein